MCAFSVTLGNMVTKGYHDDTKVEGQRRTSHHDIRIQTVHSPALSLEDYDFIQNKLITLLNNNLENMEAPTKGNYQTKSPLLGDIKQQLPTNIHLRICQPLMVVHVR